jgi:membrane fusion protein (multidrug efflux system)
LKEQNAMQMDDRDYATITEELQRLRDEQQRLRDEQEKLRREKAPSSNGNAPGTKKNEDGDKDSAKGADGKDSGDDKSKAEGQGDEKTKDEEKSKPPLKERAKAFMREHPKGILLGTIGFVVLVILAILLIMYLNSYESTDDAEIDGHLNAVSSRINGTVTKVYVQDNQAVVAGQPLLELDTHDYQTALDQAQASEANALAQLAAENPNVPITQTANQTNITSGNVDVETAQAGVTAAEQQYQAKLAELRQAEANNLKAQTDVLRYRPLVEK